MPAIRSVPLVFRPLMLRMARVKTEKAFNIVVAMSPDYTLYRVSNGQEEVSEPLGEFEEIGKKTELEAETGGIKNIAESKGAKLSIALLKTKREVM